VVSALGKRLERFDGFRFGDGVRDSTLYFDGHTLALDVVGRDAGVAAFVVRGLDARNAPLEVVRFDKDGTWAPYKVAIGPTAGDPSSFLVVTHAYADPTVGAVMADFVLDTTSTDPAPDQGAGRFVARQIVSGQTAIRALETHVLRGGAALSDATWAQEVGVHSTVAGNTFDVNVGVRIDSGHTGWLPSGVRNDAALLVLGEDGWHHALFYQDTNGATLVDIDRFGKITSQGVVLSAASSIVDFSGQATGTIRGGSVSLVLQNAAGLANNLTVADNGDVGLRAGAALARGGAPIGQSISGTLGGSTVPAATTQFGIPGAAAPGITENLRQMVMPRAGTLRNLYVATSTAQPGTGALVATLRKNGVDTTVSLSVGAGAAAGVFSDTTHTTTVAVGGLVSVSLANTAPAAASATLTSVGFALDV